MDTNRATLVICLALAAVAVINLAIFAAVRRGRSNSASQVDLLRRAVGSLNQPWRSEDQALQELSRRVAELKKKTRLMMNKLISLEQAAELVPSECTLGLGGMTLYRRPMAFVRTLLRRFQQTGEPRDLTLLAFTAGMESDLLVGAGMVKRIRTCYFGLEIFGLAPMFTYYANHGLVEVLEETETSLAMGLRAQMAGIGFMPGRGWLGTDLPSLRPDVKTITDPYNGETLMAFPAIQPDVAVIHALHTDAEGNIAIGNNKGIDEELAVTSKVVIVTAETMLPPLDRADLTAPLTDWIVAAPQGALPTSCHPNYPLDGEALVAYTEQVSDPQSFAVYLEKFIRLP